MRRLQERRTLENTRQKLPERGLMPCPCCARQLPTTALFCPACKAEKRFGPTLRESLFCTLAGVLLLPLLVWLIVQPAFWPWLCVSGGAGGGLGYAFSLFRFTTERWLQP